MSTAAKGGYKTLLKRGDGTTPNEVFTTIAEVRDVNGPGMTKLVEDATNMDSPDGYVEKISLGLRDAGQVTFQIHLLDEHTTHNNLLTDFNADTTRNFQVIPNGATKGVQFVGHVSAYGAAYPVKGIMMRDITIDITGKPAKFTVS